MLRTYVDGAVCMLPSATAIKASICGSCSFLAATSVSLGVLQCKSCSCVAVPRRRACWNANVFSLVRGLDRFTDSTLSYV